MIAVNTAVTGTEKWCMIDVGLYTCAFEMNKVPKCYIFSFLFAVTRSCQLQGYTVLSV